MPRRKSSRPSRSEYREDLAERLLAYAENPQQSGRVAGPLFSDPAEHGGVDAPGWCRKQARRLKARAHKSRKNFEAKQQERQKGQQKQQRRQQQDGD